MKKNFKLVLALVLSVMMIASMVPAMGDTGALTVNNPLTVSGLDAGDTVAYYQIIKWQSADADHIGGWVWGDGIDTTKDGINATLLEKIVGSTDGSGKIDAADAAKLSAAAKTAMTSPAGTNTNGTWTVDGVPAGLYMVIVTPATKGTLYNPIFVAANYVGDGENPDQSNSIAVSANVATYSDKAMAKKTTIPLDKVAIGQDKDDGVTNNTLADGAYTTDVGEKITFQVTTLVPKYSAEYTNPKFEITDKLEGLKLSADNNVKVYKSDESKTKGEALASSGVYTITGDSKDSEKYTVTFDSSYLKGNDIPVTGQYILIEYEAYVTDEAKVIVNQDINTVDLIFSTNPKDATEFGLKRDETNHFTFSIDADLLGHGEIEGSSTDAIKVGIDAEGNYIVKTSEYKWSKQIHGPLEGAQFGLYKKATCTTADLYTNPTFNGYVNSDATGRITITGLDAGTYYLKEISAPAGYIKLQDVVKVVIEADIEEDVEIKKNATYVGTTAVTEEVTYYTNRLNGYTVTFTKLDASGNEVGVIGATGYTINHEVTDSAKAAAADRTTANIASSDAELKNTKGVELPSTGGIGTTIFYVGGSLMVLAAAILLITKRRMGAED